VKDDAAARPSNSASNVTIPSEGNSSNLPTDSEHTFATIDELVDFVTAHWQERWVTTDIWDENVLDALLRRPFFLLVSIDAPLSMRWKRFSDRYEPNSFRAQSRV
jgi:dCMP deaminase